MALTSAEGRPYTTTGTVDYTKDSPTEDLYRNVYEDTTGSLTLEEQEKRSTNLERTTTEVRVEDLRPSADHFTLRTNGFALKKLGVPNDIDWENRKMVEGQYYPLAAEMLKKETGASRVHIFDHTLRQGHVSSEQKLDIPGKIMRQPVGLVHVDYTAKGGPNRLQHVLPEEAEKLSRTPYAIVQAWRPLKGPVESSPLGLIDATTVNKADYINYTIYFPGRTGYNYAIKENPSHRWYYVKDMDVDEALIFVCYDSRQDRARFTPHTGFRDHSAAPNAAPRESIELRSLCFFENEPQQEPASEL